MAAAEQIEQRIKQLQQVLRDRKKLEKRKQDEQLLSLFRKSGLSKIDLENLILSSRKGAANE